MTHSSNKKKFQRWWYSSESLFVLVTEGRWSPSWTFTRMDRSACFGESGRSAECVIVIVIVIVIVDLQS